MTKHFCRSRAETFPLWGPWYKEPGDPVFLCACGFIGGDNDVHRADGYTDCPACAEAQDQWRSERNARKHTVMLNEAGPAWRADPIVHGDGSITAQISSGPLVARRIGDRWTAEVRIVKGSLSARGPTLLAALRDLRLSITGCLDVDLLRVREARAALDHIASVVHPDQKEAP